jgi:aldose 1-epimerase
VGGSDRLARSSRLTDPQRSPPPSGDQFEIRAGEQRAVVTEVGAGLRAYDVDGRAVVAGYDAHEIAPSGRGQLLAPWPNRIDRGRYEFGGRAHQLPIDELEHCNAIHGLTRWSVWRPAAREPDRVVLIHRLPPRPGFPFLLTLEADYSLGRNGLTVRTSATNEGNEPLPYGNGSHPYLALGAATADNAVLRLPAREALHSNERGIPTGRFDVRGTDLDFAEPREIRSLVLDHCFTALARDDDGLARVHVAAAGVATELWADEAYPYLMVFTGDTLPEGGRRSVAVEPMTCAPNAFRSGDGLIRLAPGETHIGSWGITRRR